jgi:hypothetical protein
MLAADGRHLLDALRNTMTWASVQHVAAKQDIMRSVVAVRDGCRNLVKRLPLQAVVFDVAVTILGVNVAAGQIDARPGFLAGGASCIPLAQTA